MCRPLLLLLRRRSSCGAAPKVAVAVVLQGAAILAGCVPVAVVLVAVVIASGPVHFPVRRRHTGAVDPAVVKAGKNQVKRANK